MTIQPYFEGIRLQIIKSIHSANTHISVAVCWFTNQELFDLLCEKLKNGVTIELIILDDYTNANPFGCDFSKFLTLGGQLYLSSVEKPMHNKYCIIDNNILITGSYNWTYFAETKNQENVVLFENASTVVNEYKADFERLKNIAKKATAFRKMVLLTRDNSINEDKTLNTFSAANMLSNDLFQKAVETKDIKLYEEVKKLDPYNVKFQKKAIELNWEKTLVLTEAISEKVVGNKIKLIFQKGTQIPAENIANFTTAEDFQKAMGITILAGANPIASKNRVIGKYQIENLPLDKAGKVTFFTEFSISTNGFLHIRKHIHDTGLVDKRLFNLKKLELFK
jgi:hypothetical protein